MRFLKGWMYALAALSIAVSHNEAAGYDILATVFDFGSVPPDDPNPNLTGVIKIDSETGVASPFIPTGTGGIFLASDVAVGPHDGLIYVSTQAGGQIARFDAAGNPLGAFAFFPLGEDQTDSVNTLRFAPDGTLYAALGSGTVAQFAPNGTRQSDIATGLTFPSGIALGSGDEIFIATGQAGGPGEVIRVDAGGTNTVIGPGTIGGAGGLTYLAARGDYNADDENTADDYTAWVAAYGSGDVPTDGNGDGVVDAADYTIWRDNQGETAQLLVPDFTFAPSGNRIYAYDLVEETGETLTTIPVALPDPLPDPPAAFPTNFPSEVFLTEQGTLLVSTIGPGQRPINSAAVLEFNRDGSLVRVIQTDLPPLSGIDIAPIVVAETIPEPSAVLLVLLAATSTWARTRR